MSESDSYRFQARAAREAAIGYRRSGDELDLLALRLDRLADALDKAQAIEAGEKEGNEAPLR